jgi:hypothetical protein
MTPPLFQKHFFGNNWMGDTMGKDNDSRDLDWENRVLCSDESCIGVIGADGCCKECAKPYEGELPTTFSKPTDQVQPSPPPSPDAREALSIEDVQQDIGQPTGIDGEWEQRTLCSDESCIGVIGPDGRCKECGLPLKGDK